MAIAFTFPGQGSQAVGMGKDLADAFPEARKVFDEVDDALGEKLSRLIWESPEETLTLTANAQPALMAVSMAAVRALESHGFSLKDKVAYVAGHSLGDRFHGLSVATMQPTPERVDHHLLGKALGKRSALGLENRRESLVSLDRFPVCECCRGVDG